MLFICNFIKLIKSTYTHISFLTLIILVLFINAIRKDIVVFPSADPNNCTSYSDANSINDTGNSIINTFRKECDKIVFNYTLNNKTTYPYAGFQWHYRNHYLNLSNSYSNLILTIDPDSTTVKNMLIMLQVFCSGFSDTSNSLSWRFLTKELFLRKGVSKYSIPLDEFVTPDWWYKRLNTSEHELGKPNLAQTALINIQSSSDSIGTSKCIFIKELRFIQGNRIRIYFIYITILCVIIIIYYLIRRNVTKHSSNRFSHSRFETCPVVPITYEKIEVENGVDQEERIITEYVGKNFTNPELSLLRMSMDLGIPTYKISTFIKKKHNLSFKQYLNTIRITEAKRLLKSSDLQISQIAYRVGYSTAPHFNRIFKELTSQSPNAYRSTDA